MISELGTGNDIPQDDDYFISQYVGGNASGNFSFFLRRMSNLWNYIKAKINPIAIPDTGWVDGASLLIKGNILHLRRIGGLVMIRYINAPLTPSNQITFDITKNSPSYVDVIDFSKNSVLNECFGSNLLEGIHCIGDSLFAEIRTNNKAITISLYMMNLALSSNLTKNVSRFSFNLCIPAIGTFPKSCATNLGGTSLDDYLI